MEQKHSPRVKTCAPECKCRKDDSPAFDALIEAAGKTLEKVSIKDAGIIGVELCRALSQLGKALEEAKKARGI